MTGTPHNCGHSLLNESCGSCKTLHKEWSLRLEASGFVDIEEKNQKKMLSLLEHDGVNDAAFIGYYFSRLREALVTENFEVEIHELIMMKKAEGDKISEIERFLKKKGSPVHRETIRHIIRRFEKKWKIRQWTWKEMGLRAPTGSPRIRGQLSLRIT